MIKIACCAGNVHFRRVVLPHQPSLVGELGRAAAYPYLPVM